METLKLTDYMQTPHTQAGDINQTYNPRGANVKCAKHRQQALIDACWACTCAALCAWTGDLMTEVTLVFRPNQTILKIFCDH